MNMQKLGIVVQSKMPLLNLRKTSVTRMNSALRAIHYANIRVRQGGIVRGTVSRLTEEILQLGQLVAASAPAGAASSRPPLSNTGGKGTVPATSVIGAETILALGFRSFFRLYVIALEKITIPTLGTSPHGLSAKLRQVVRKLAAGSGYSHSAKPVLGFGGAL